LAEAEGERDDIHPFRCATGEDDFLGLRGVESGAQLRIRGHAFQVAHHAHGPVQRFRHRVQRVQRVVESAFAIGGGERGQARAGFAQ